MFIHGKLTLSYAVLKSFRHMYCASAKRSFSLKRAAIQKHLCSCNMTHIKFNGPFLWNRGSPFYSSVLHSERFAASSTSGVKNKNVETSGNEKFSNAAKSLRSERSPIKNTNQKVGLQ